MICVGFYLEKHPLRRVEVIFFCINSMEKAAFKLGFLLYDSASGNSSPRNHRVLFSLGSVKNIKILNIEFKIYYGQVIGFSRDLYVYT